MTIINIWTNKVLSKFDIVNLLFILIIGNKLI